MAASPIHRARSSRRRPSRLPAADGKSVTVQTDHQGNFQFNALAPGSYNVTVTAKGFAVDQEAE